MMITTAPRAMPRRPYVRLNSRSDSPIFVPPSQSGAAWPASASAAAGVEWASVRVSRVSRVANVNTSAFAPPAAQYSSWIMARAYGSIDPEMSHSTTSLRGRQAGSWPMSRTGSPPVRRAWPSVARTFRCRPPGRRRRRRDLRRGVARVSVRISPAS